MTLQGPEKQQWFSEVWRMHFRKTGHVSLGSSGSQVGAQVTRISSLVRDSSSLFLFILSIQAGTCACSVTCSAHAV